MATGSGKTFTAVTPIYRLIKFAGARRVLFLVDRGNLGRQTLKEFQQYVTPDDGRKFTELYNVQHLQSNTHRPGQPGLHHDHPAPLLDAEGRAGARPRRTKRGRCSTPDRRSSREPLPVVYNPTIPIETFDFIVIDECHRSIYNLWRQVLDYFDAYLDRPDRHALEADLRLLQPEPGDGVQPRAGRGRRRERRLRRLPHPDRRSPRQGATRRSRASASTSATAAPAPKRWEQLDDDLTYAPNQLDRDVVAEDQIRTVVRTFKDRLFTEIFPGRTEVPKTLIFAKDDSHADDIVQIVREEFGKGNDFCQKITYRTDDRATTKPRGHSLSRDPSATATTRASPSPWT